MEPSAALAQTSKSTLKAGDLLGPYRLQQLIAETAYCSIFKATHTGTGLPVAIKAPHLEAESDVVFYDRFAREAAIGRALDHPGIPKILTESLRSNVYLAITWMQGETLRQFLDRQGKLPPDQALRIALGICEVLEYIHGNGVIHRDLKPENIIIAEDNSIKLIDFGIAAMSGARRLTFGNFSRLMGTPDYVSPEQVKGERGDVRSDLYALGVILYEMLAGQTPFPGDSPLIIMNSRVHNNPTPIRDLAPEVSPAIECILARLLARNPKARYTSAAELALDLEFPNRVPLADTTKHAPPNARRRIIYLSAILPILLFLTLLLVAYHQKNSIH